MINRGLAEKNKCTGCFACASICPVDCLKMHQDNDGFYYPIVSDINSCIECNQCHDVCPVVNDITIKNDNNIAAFAAYSNDESLRLDSSSGGLFSELAISFINRGGIVYGAAFDEDWQVIHIAVDNINDLHLLRTAKYSQSNLGDIYREIQKQLKKGEPVLFVGTPCQVAGLKAFLKHHYEKLVCLDFVCHGIPAPGVWAEYVKYRALTDNQGNYPVNINFRSKTSGWSRYKYSVNFKYDNGKEYNGLSGSDPFMNLFTNDYINRESCSACKFKGNNRLSDITLGDFWGIWDIDPAMDDNKGTSMVIINTRNGKELFDSISQNLTFRDVSLEDCSMQNQSLVYSSKANIKRDEVLQDIINKGFKSTSKILKKRSNPIKIILKRLLKKI